MDAARLRHASHHLAPGPQTASGGYLVMERRRFACVTIDTAGAKEMGAFNDKKDAETFYR